MNQINTGGMRYFSSVEWLRFLAAFGIVWFHTENAMWRSVGYAGLPIFLLVFGFLIVVHFDEITFSEFIKRRTLRLLIPWFFWSFVYIAAKFFKTVCIDKDTPVPFSLNTILVGGSLHLWFLPFSFLVALVFWVICRFTFVRQKEDTNGTVFISLLLLVIIAVFTLCDYIRMNNVLPAPFSQWLFALPSLPIGLAFGYIMRSAKIENRLLLLSVVYGVVFGVCLNSYRMWNSLSLVSYGIGTLLTVAAIFYPLPFETTARKVSALTYGIYLIHPLIASLFDIIFHIPIPLIKMIIVFILSTIAVYFMKRTVFRFVM